MDSGGFTFSTVPPLAKKCHVFELVAKLAVSGYIESPDHPKPPLGFGPFIIMNITSKEKRLATSKAKNILINNGFYVIALSDGHYCVGKQGNDPVGRQSAAYKFTHPELLKAASHLIGPVGL